MVHNFPNSFEVDYVLFHLTQSTLIFSATFSPPPSKTPRASMIQNPRNKGGFEAQGFHFAKEIAREQASRVEETCCPRVLM